MINLYVKFNKQSSYAIVLKVADRRKHQRTDAPGEDNSQPPACM